MGTEENKNKEQDKKDVIILQSNVYFTDAREIYTKLKEHCEKFVLPGEEVKPSSIKFSRVKRKLWLLECFIINFYCHSKSSKAFIGFDEQANQIFGYRESNEPQYIQSAYREFSRFANYTYMSDHEKYITRHIVASLFYNDFVFKNEQYYYLPYIAAEYKKLMFSIEKTFAVKSFLNKRNDSKIKKYYIRLKRNKNIYDSYRIILKFRECVKFYELHEKNLSIVVKSMEFSDMNNGSMFVNIAYISFFKFLFPHSIVISPIRFINSKSLCHRILFYKSFEFMLEKLMEAMNYIKESENINKVSSSKIFMMSKKDFIEIMKIMTPPFRKFLSEQNISMMNRKIMEECNKIKLYGTSKHERLTKELPYNISMYQKTPQIFNYYYAPALKITNNSGVFRFARENRTSIQGRHLVLQTRSTSNFEESAVRSREFKLMVNSESKYNQSMSAFRVEEFKIDSTDFQKIVEEHIKQEIQTRQEQEDYEWEK